MMQPVMPLFERLLGTAYAGLPTSIRKIHDGNVSRTFTGYCCVKRGNRVLARLLGWLISLPASGDDVPIIVTIKLEQNGEIWLRQFAGKFMRSRLTQIGGHLEETLGPVRFLFALHVEDQAIVWTVFGVRAIGLPLPAAWFGKVSAREFAEEGKYRFDVRAELPLAGLLIHYQGWLQVE